MEKKVEEKIEVIEAVENIGLAKKSVYRRKVMNVRDMRILMFCFEQYFLTREQIRHWLMIWSGSKNENVAKVVTIRIVQLLLQNKLIERFHSSRLGRQAAFHVTKRGIRQLQKEGFIRTEAEVAKISAENIRHDKKVTEVRLKWESIAQIEDWFPESQLKKGGKEHVPDAVMVAPVKPKEVMARICIEVELTQKSRSRYEAKIAEYSSGAYDLIFYFVSEKAICQTIWDLSRNKTSKFYVCFIDDFLKQGADCRLKSYRHELRIGDGFEPPKPWHRTEIIPIELVKNQGVARVKTPR